MISLKNREWKRDRVFWEGGGIKRVREWEGQTEKVKREKERYRVKERERDRDSVKERNLI